MFQWHIRFHCECLWGSSGILQQGDGITDLSLSVFGFPERSTVGTSVCNVCSLDGISNIHLKIQTAVWSFGSGLYFKRAVLTRTLETLDKYVLEKSVQWSY